MAKFNIYTYQFSPIPLQTNLFEAQRLTLRECMNNKHQIFTEVLNAETLKLTYRNKEYPHRMLYANNDVYVLQIANRKSVVLEQNFQRMSIDNAPSVYVIIDNRENSQRILIEDEVAFSDTSVIQNILLSSFKSILATSGLVIRIEKEYERSEFWNVVDAHPESITMVRFQMMYPNLPRISQHIHDLLRDASETVNSHNTSLELKAEPGTTLILSRDNEQLHDLNNASADSGCVTKIKINGLRSFVSTGQTTKSIEIDNLEAELDNPDFLNQILGGIQ